MSGLLYTVVTETIVTKTNVMETNVTETYVSNITIINYCNICLMHSYCYRDIPTAIVVVSSCYRGYFYHRPQQLTIYKGSLSLYLTAYQPRPVLLSGTSL